MRVKANLVRWLVCLLVLTCPVQAQYGGGSGEPNDPYLIYTAEQMNTIGANPNDWDKHFKLMADIDLSAYSGTQFNIIGFRYGDAFMGVFDGNGHTISNFSYTPTDREYTGLFGYVEGKDAETKDLGLIDPNVDAGTGDSVGSLVGYMDGGTITNCYVEGGSVSGDRIVGGLVGKNNGTITNCYATGSILGTTWDVGGLVGRNNGTITNCYANGDVTATGRVVGGLVGTNSGKLVNCYSQCSVDAEDMVGGLVGTNSGNIVNCYSHCIVDAEDKVGGLVGMNNGIVMASCSSASIKGREEVGGLVGRNSYHGEIVDCYSNGDILGQRYVGGLVGNNRMVMPRGGGPLFGTIRTCYSATAVSGDQQIGGLVGYDQGGGVRDCFWDMETSGQTTSDGGVGKTTAEMQDPNTFIDTGWDFVGAPNGPSDIWAEPDGAGYPVLWWQLSPLPELPTFSGGTGEPDEPYLISTADELNSIGHNPRLMAAHFKLVDDIDLADTEFFVIASPLYPFRGTFDGKGHTISNFSYTSADVTCIGLVGYAVGAEIKDLGLIGPNVNVDRGNFHGCLVGHLYTGAITNCYVEAGSVSGYDYIGGLLGSNSGTVTNCYFSGDVYGHNTVGGLVGENSGTVTNCRSNCSVDGSDNTGGLVGYNGGSVMVSYTYASVTGNFRVGGLVGRNSDGEIVNCYAKGDVLGQRHIGGLVGGNATSERDISTIRNCYSATSVLDGFQPGGLVGNDQGGEVRDSFWDIETSGRTLSFGGTGKTTAEMKMAITFVGWLCDPVWTLDEGRDYPRLWWENAPGEPIIIIYTLYVDDDSPDDPGPGDPQISDPLEDGSEAHPFDTIQEAIDDVAHDCSTVLVRRGQYLKPQSDDTIDFFGKNITLRSSDPTNWDTVNSTVIRGSVQFGGTEDSNCRLTGFRIHDPYGAIYGNNTRATISYCVISGNGPCGATVIKDCDGTISNCLIADNTTFFFCNVFPVVSGCDGLIKNCTIVNNISGVSVGTATIENCIIYNNAGSQIGVNMGETLSISYSNVQGGLEAIVGDGDVVWGPGNIDMDPRFVRLGYSSEEPLELTEGDYHLRSEGWHWNTEGKSWTYDYVTSPCIDAGSPDSPLADEPLSIPRDPDNEYGVNLRINMGAFGGTRQASMPPLGWPPWDENALEKYE